MTVTYGTLVAWLLAVMVTPGSAAAGLVGDQAGDGGRARLRVHERWQQGEDRDPDRNNTSSTGSRHHDSSRERGRNARFLSNRAEMSKHLRRRRSSC